MKRSLLRPHKNVAVAVPYPQQTNHFLKPIYINYMKWALGVVLAWMMCLLLTATNLYAQSGKPLLRVDGEEKAGGVKVATTSELLIEAPFVVKRVKILRKNFNEYRLESFVDVKPASKNVGMILAVSANKIKSGDQIQLLLIPENETLKVSEDQSVIYLTIE